MLEALGLCVTLGGTPVLRAVDFSARPGALTAIAGPNGSGKTTLLRALTGDIAASGTLRLNGGDLRGTSLHALAQIRAVLPQATPLAFPFTVTEVVRLGAPTAQITQQALARVGLQAHGGRLYQDLSGGEQQRVQLARVLAQVWQPVVQGAPRWLFLDEPVSSLDIGHQLVVMRLAREFADAGGGVVAVMHDLNLTAMFADEVALIAGGRVLGQGTPQHILTDALLTEAYHCHLRVSTPPPRGPYLLPQAAGGRISP